MPKVTVIIPNYNHARFLQQRIQSVLNQTYQDFEVIYLDDASTDNSNEVFASFADDQRVRAIYNETNSGSPFKQWNKGIRQATGEYIWIAESDDYADEKLLATLVDRLDRYPQAGLAYAQSWAVDKSGKVGGSWLTWTDGLDKERWQHDFVANGQEECRKFLVFRNTIPNASAVLLRRNVYEKTGFADATLRLNGDWLQWIKMLLISDLVFVAQPLNYFRTHNRSVRHTSRIAGIQESYLIQKYLQRHLRLPPQVVASVTASLFYQWSEYALFPPGATVWKFWRQNLKIYRLARQVDRRVTLRLMRRLGIFLLDKLGCLKFLRAFWRTS